MIGYVKIFKPELKVKEYELYRGIYCSLCRTLGKEYGVISRMLLSYDLTFLTLVLLSRKEASLSFKNGRCPFNALKKCNFCSCEGEAFSFSAAVTVLMFYYKIKDEIADSGFFRKLAAYFLLPYAALLRKKALKKFIRLDEIISESMIKQSQCENENISDVDKAAHNSADALGKIFAFFEKNDSLYRFGYLLGRWVYLTDAADDFNKDLKNKSFNVFVNKYSVSSENDISDEIVNDIEETLNLSQGVLAECFVNNDFGKFSPIIENVIFDSFTNTILNFVKGIRKQ